MNRGYTLLEICVVIVIIMVLMTLLIGVIRWTRAHA